MPYLYFTLAGVALVAAMWLCVRRTPPTTVARSWAAWHAVRATLAAGNSTLAALFVLLGLGQLH